MISERLRPRGRDLDHLEARRRHLASYPTASAESIAARLARMFLRFPATAKGSPEMVAAYALDLARFPLWAIDKGLADIIRGVSTRADAFPPTSPQVQAAVVEAMRPVTDELSMLAAVLDAEVVPDIGAPTDEECERVRAKLEQFKADIAAKNGFSPPLRASDARDRPGQETPLEPWKPGDPPAPRFSSGLRKALGLPVQQEEDAA